MTSQIRIYDVNINESDSGTNLTFTVSLDAANPTEAVTVDFTTSSSSAIGGQDFTPVSGTLTFPPNTTTQTITVPIIGDTAYEAAEVFVVELSNPSANAAIEDGQGIGVILNDDPIPTLRIDDISLTEENTNAIFTVSLAGETAEVVAVSYATANHTATAGTSDYTSSSGTLFFLPGETSKTILVPVLDDSLNEANETFFVNLSGAFNAAIEDGQGIGTITNNDPAPNLTITDVTIAETPGGSNAVFTVSLSEGSGQAVTVNYSTANDTAIAGEDYTATTGTLTFNAGTQTQTITVPILDDAKYEPGESFGVNLSGAENAVITDGQGVGTITSDDLLPTLSITDVSFNEADGGTATLDFTVSLSGASSQPVTVTYHTADNTATTANNDYVEQTGTLTFTPDQTTQTISIQVNADDLYELDESFLVTLTDAVGATIAKAEGIGTITNDDSQPTIAISDVTVLEGNSGTTTASFTVSLSSASTQLITVNYATADGSADTADFTSASGAIQFAAGETSKTINVAVKGDAIDESDETFLVNLTDAINASISDNQGIGTVADDDGVPSIIVEDVSVNEGNSSTTIAFTVSLSNPNTQTVQVNFTTGDDTATTANNDYLNTTGTLIFNPGQTSQTIEITVEGDSVVESDEAFWIDFSNPVNATLAANQAKVILLNDDSEASPPPEPAITIDDISLSEGNDNTVDAVFTVSLSSASSKAISVDYATANGTASADDDYLSSSGTLTFAAGETSKTITVQVNGDTLTESNETFFVNLSNVSGGATLSDGQGLGTIANDDTDVAPSDLPNLSINDISLTEGNSGTTDAIFTVSLDSPSTSPATVRYTTVNATASPLDEDYTSTSGTLTFSPGQTTQTVTVQVNGDTRSEGNETFYVRLSSATNGVIADPWGMATITDDEALPTLSIDDINLNEGNGGITNATFTVSLSAPSSQTVTVDYATIDETATTANADYTAVTSSLTFDPGQTTKTITVAVTGDTTVELDETFSLRLTNPQNAGITKAIGVATLINEDSPAIDLPTEPTEPTEPAEPTEPTEPTDPNPDNGSGNNDDSGSNPLNPDDLLNPDDSPIPDSPPGAPEPILGTREADVLAGSDGDDQIFGFSGDDILQGGGGNDLLNGGSGNDRLFGGDGIDLLVGKYGKDKLLGGDGDDVLFGSKGDDQLYGEQGNDRLYGKKGRDLLSGGEGDDTLLGNFDRDRISGGSGKDRFVFRKLADRVDRIVDFSVKDDTIMVLRSSFKAGLKPRASINADQFRIGSQARDGSDRFIYNRATGSLSFDADGQGGSAQLQIAQLSKNLAMTHQDIAVIASLGAL